MDEQQKHEDYILKDNLNQILSLQAFPLHFDPDDKIYKGCYCQEFCDCPRKSYNDWISMIDQMSGINPELLGPADG